LGVPLKMGEVLISLLTGFRWFKGCLKMSYLFYNDSLAR